MNHSFCRGFWGPSEFALAIKRKHRQNSRHVRLRADDFYRGIFAFPSPAADRQIHPAVVRRRDRRLDDLHVVLPDAAVGRLRLRAFYLPLAEAAPPGDSASGPARRGVGPAAHYARRFVEAGRRRKSNVANPRPADCEPWPAVFRPLVHGSPDATLVQPHEPRRVALPALRAFECRLIAGARQLSGLFRNPFHAQSAGCAVGMGTGPVCRRLRLLRNQTVAGKRCRGSRVE